MKGERRQRSVEMEEEERETKDGEVLNGMRKGNQRALRGGIGNIKSRD